MTSARFKNAIATQLAKLTGGEPALIARAIDRPKLKGLGSTFAIPLPRLFPSTTALPKKKLKPGLTSTSLDSSVSSEGTRPFDTTGLIRSVKPMGQFLNFGVDERQYIRETIQDVVRAEIAKQHYLTSHENDTDKIKHGAHLGYGMDASVGNGKVVAIDYSSPNIAKPFHGGHLRGTILGNFATRLLRGFGYHVIGINYLGDWGKQYGLMAVGFDRYGDRKELVRDPIKHLYDVYVKINKDIVENPELDKKANEYFKRMEENDPTVLSLWQEFRSLSIDFYRVMYKRLGIEFDVYSGESESAQFVPQAYALLRDTGLLQEQDDGAWIVDLTVHGLGVCTLRRADGTTLYLTRDVAACLQRADKFKFDRHLYMIGDDQNLHMKRLFKIMELAFSRNPEGLSNPDQPHWSRCLQHISFGKVQGMSTRKGTAIFLEDILDTAQTTMLDRMKENESRYEAVKESIRLQNLSEESALTSSDAGVEQVADKLGISAVVIQDFQAKSSKGYDFSWKRMTESTGNTGIYLQYAHARLCGIEEKSGTKLDFEANPDFLTEPEAFELANVISMYPEITASALQTFEPSLIVNYLFGLSHAISSANQVLQVKTAMDAGEMELAESRRLLLWAARVTLGNGMRVLGLDPLERM
ncbi:Arginyl-tRNA synthetase [Gryganskiella cystojenkinii]|nr:Arginyl-tRNA synthetase [Gryganskiella cystojenkinii]